MFLGSYSPPYFAHAVCIAGEMAYLAIDGYGVEMISVSDPTAPKLLGTLDTPDRAWNVDVAGGIAGVVNNDTLQIFDVSGCGACAPDLDGNGTLDLFDFLAFTNLFNAGDLAADFDGDGVLDLFDFLAFTNAFNAGC